MIERALDKSRHHGVEDGSLQFGFVVATEHPQPFDDRRQHGDATILAGATRLEGVHHHPAAEAGFARDPLPSPEHRIEHVLIAGMRPTNVIGDRLAVLAELDALPAPVGIDRIVGIR